MSSSSTSASSPAATQAIRAYYEEYYRRHYAAVAATTTAAVLQVFAAYPPADGAFNQNTTPREEAAQQAIAPAPPPPPPAARDDAAAAEAAAVAAPPASPRMVLEALLKWGIVLYIMYQHTTTFVFLILVVSALITIGVQLRWWRNPLMYFAPSNNENNNENNAPNATIGNEAAGAEQQRQLQPRPLLQRLMPAVLLALVPGTHPLDPATSAAEHIQAADDWQAGNNAENQNW